MEGAVAFRVHGSPAPLMSQYACPVPFEQRVNGVVVPARVPELYGHPDPPRHAVQEAVEAGVVALHRPLVVCSQAVFRQFST
jgi:hypothetical protein